MRREYYRACGRRVPPLPGRYVPLYRQLHGSKHKIGDSDLWEDSVSSPFLAGTSSSPSIPGRLPARSRMICPPFWLWGTTGKRDEGERKGRRARQVDWCAAGPRLHVPERDSEAEGQWGRTG